MADDKIWSRLNYLVNVKDILIRIGRVCGCGIFRWLSGYRRLGYGDRDLLGGGGKGDYDYEIDGLLDTGLAVDVGLDETEEAEKENPAAVLTQDDIHAYMKKIERKMRDGPGQGDVEDPPSTNGTEFVSSSLMFEHSRQKSNQQSQQSWGYTLGNVRKLAPPPEPSTHNITPSSRQLLSTSSGDEGKYSGSGPSMETALMVPSTVAPKNIPVHFTLSEDPDDDDILGGSEWDSGTHSGMNVLSSGHYMEDDFTTPMNTDGSGLMEFVDSASLGLEDQAEWPWTSSTSSNPQEARI